MTVRIQQSLSSSFEKNFNLHGLKLMPCEGLGQQYITVQRLWQIRGIWISKQPV